MTARKLEAAAKMLDEILPPGSRMLVGNRNWHGHSVRGWAREYRIGWRTVEQAKRLAGNIRAVKQPGRMELPWIWVRE